MRFIAGTGALERERPGDFDTPAFGFLPAMDGVTVAGLRRFPLVTIVDFPKHA